MPRIVDKIITNDGSSTGERARVVAEYGNLKLLGQELKDLKLLDARTDAFTAEMEALCEAHLKADDDFVQGMRDLGAKIRKFIDANI